MLPKRFSINILKNKPRFPIDFYGKCCKNIHETLLFGNSGVPNLQNSKQTVLAI